MGMLILELIWCVIGTTGFIYWHTLKNDFTADIALVTTAILSGLLGVFTWVIGAVVYNKNTHRIILRRRGR